MQDVVEGRTDRKYILLRSCILRQSLFLYLKAVISLNGLRYCYCFYYSNYQKKIKYLKKYEQIKRFRKLKINNLKIISKKY